MSNVWTCQDCGSTDHTRTTTHMGPRCEPCTLTAMQQGKLCGLVISDGLEGSGTGRHCQRLAGHDCPHDVNRQR
jgi:hypothetical protein